MGAAINHQLSPMIDHVFDVEAALEDVNAALQKQGKRVAFAHWQQLLTLPVNWHGSKDGRTFHLLIDMPVIKLVHSDRMVLYYSQEGPLYFNNSVIQIQSDEEYLAQDPKSKGIITLSKSDLENKCRQVGTSYFCSHGLIQSVVPQSFGTCLSSIYMKDYTQVAKRCTSHQYPFEENVWNLDQNSYLLLMVEPTDIFISCENARLNKAMHAPRGLTKLTLSHLSCKLLSHLKSSTQVDNKLCVQLNL